MGRKLERQLRQLLEADLSHSDIHDALRTEIRLRFPDAYVWLADVYDDAVVYEVEPKAADGEAARPSAYYRTSYTLTDAGDVVLGDDMTVVQKRTVWDVVTEPVTATEAEIVGECIPLLEAKVRRDGTVPIKIIAPGKGSSGYYPAEVLERDGPKVFVKGLKSFWDHPTTTEESERPERSLRDLAGVLASDARWEAAGSAGPGLYADVEVFAPYREPVAELAPHIGMSIVASGRAAMGDVEGLRMPIISELVSAKSVDFVTAAGAGGQILSLFEAARAPRTEEFQPTYLEADMANEQELKEARDALAVSEAQTQTLTEQLAERDRELARLREGQLLAEARAFVAEHLPADLPELTHARLLESLSKTPAVTDGALDAEAYKTKIAEAVKAEVEYLARVTNSGSIRGMGVTDTQPPDDTTPTAEARLAESYRLMGYSPEQATQMAKGR